MLKFIDDKRIYKKELTSSFYEHSSYININNININIQLFRFEKIYDKKNKRKLEILIKIIIYLNFMELFLNLIVKLTNEGFYLRGIYKKNTINKYYSDDFASIQYSFQRKVCDELSVDIGDVLNLSIFEYYYESGVYLSSLMCLIVITPEQCRSFLNKFSYDLLKNIKYSYKYFFIRRAGR
jgi:hypothetical protein